MKTTLLCLTSLLSSFMCVSAFAAASCPNLKGSYACPAIPGQDPLRFKLEQIQMGDKTKYLFHYQGFPDDSSIASPTGELNPSSNGDYFVFCVDKSLIYVPKQNDNGKLQQSYRGHHGAFVVKVKGKEVIRCAQTRQE